MSEFEINDVKYRADKLDAMQQFHVARRIAPVIAVVPNVLKSIKGDIGALQPLLEIVGKMPDDDVNYIISECMSVVYRLDGPGYVRVWTRGTNKPMFADMDMTVLLRIVFQVVSDNLLPFMNAGQQASPDQKPA